jgi:hypothetical protein
MKSTKGLNLAFCSSELRRKISTKGQRLFEVLRAGLESFGKARQDSPEPQDWQVWHENGDLS